MNRGNQHIVTQLLQDSGAIRKVVEEVRSNLANLDETTIANVAYGVPYSCYSRGSSDGTVMYRVM
jgi:hypothetical protein